VEKINLQEMRLRLTLVDDPDLLRELKDSILLLLERQDKIIDWINNYEEQVKKNEEDYRKRLAEVERISRKTHKIKNERMLKYAMERICPSCGTETKYKSNINTWYNGEYGPHTCYIICYTCGFRYAGEDIRDLNEKEIIYARNHFMVAWNEDNKELKREIAEHNQRLKKEKQIEAERIKKEKRQKRLKYIQWGLNFLQRKVMEPK
jgi:excinuclease UvrABC ATPase subunit